MKKYLYPAIAAVLLGIGIYLGYLWFKPKPSATVDSQTIVTALKQEGFLVTQAYVFNQQVKINRDSGNVFKDFFWGQDITASANMKVNSGVDLNKISLANITVTDERITLELPAVETHSIELLGEITLQNKQGVLKRIFDNNDGYNEAYQTLQTEAGLAAATTTLRTEAENSTQKEIRQLVGLIAPNRQIEITFKK